MADQAADNLQPGFTEMDLNTLKRLERLPFARPHIHLLFMGGLGYTFDGMDAALIAFIIGLGCVAGAVGVSLFYRASNLAEFQAIQMWRIEWLLAATASFVAGILLKKPSDSQ